MRTTDVQNMLRIFKQGALIQEVALEGKPLTVGRHKDVDIQLEDVQLSRFHADITMSGEQYFITDRGSLNGTLLNGARLAVKEPAAIENGSVVSIPPFELHFEFADARPITAATVFTPASSDSDQDTQDPAPQAAAAPEPPLEKTNSLGVDSAAPVPILETPPAEPAPIEPPAPAPVAAPEPAPSEVFEQAPEAGLLLTHLIEQRESVPIWSKGNTTLVVADIIEETHDVKTFRMVGLSPILFSYLPGQFVTLKLVIDGKKIKRSYTISSSPSRPHSLEITVKRVAGGLVSNWLSDNIKLGDQIEASGPAGKFSCFNYPSQKILCIGGGSGITPVMSMSRWVVDTAADVDVHLLAAYHSPMDVVYRRELEMMASRASSFRVSVAVSSAKGPEPWTGLTGRISADMLKLVCPDIHERHIFMCGPEGFMECVKDCLRSLDYPMANLHTESFGAGRVAKNVKVEPRDVPKRPPTVIGVAPAPAAPVTPPNPADFFAASGESDSAPVAPAPPVAELESAPADPAAPEPVAAAGYQIRFAISDRDVATDGDSDLLELAEVNGIEIDYSCRSGSCQSCRVKCTSGDVDMEDADLEDDERAEGWILPCVAYPKSDLTIEA
jgi:glycine betaine catabolism B